MYFILDKNMYCSVLRYCDNCYIPLYIFCLFSVKILYGYLTRRDRMWGLEAEEKQSYNMGKGVQL